MDTPSAHSLLAQLNDLASNRAHKLELLPFSVVLLVSLAAAILVAFLYRRFASSRATSAPLHRTFPLLAIAVTAIFVCIQFSLPLSLGLLGALSIVRFRTPIKEPEEIGFILVVIACSLACATFNLVLLVGILGVTLIGLVLRQVVRPVFQSVSEDGSLVLTVAASDYAARGKELMALLEGALPKPRLESLSHHGDDVVLALTFRATPAASVTDLESRLAAIARPRNLTVLFGRAGV